MRESEERGDNDRIERMRERREREREQTQRSVEELRRQAHNLLLNRGCQEVTRVCIATDRGGNIMKVMKRGGERSRSSTQRLTVKHNKLTTHIFAPD